MEITVNIAYALLSLIVFPFVVAIAATRYYPQIDQWLSERSKHLRFRRKIDAIRKLKTARKIANDAVYRDLFLQYYTRRQVQACALFVSGTCSCSMFLVGASLKGSILVFTDPMMYSTIFFYGLVIASGALLFGSARWHEGILAIVENFDTAELAFVKAYGEKPDLESETASEQAKTI